jgi:hypothetical protein
VVKNPNSAHGGILCRTGCFEKSAEIRLFSKLARSLQSCVHLAEGPPEHQPREFEMTTTSISQRLVSVVAAFAMSAMLMVSYFYVPAVHAVQGIIA